MKPEDFTRHPALRSSGYELMAYGPLSAFFLLLPPSLLSLVMSVGLALFTWIIIQRRLVKMWGPLRPALSPIALGLAAGAVGGCVVFGLGFAAEAELVFLSAVGAATCVAGFTARWREWVAYGGTLMAAAALNYWQALSLYPGPWAGRVWILATVLGPLAVLVGARANTRLFWPRPNCPTT